ncbi:DUF4333 domain-containing protein [Nocardiopsis sp. NPDC049922]|uniref:DUF4333 domain-containing protein n=1 Tax=Nocardiopsis sp. NPDC049922 TaxID=3155157 RepID=UPI0033C1B3D6
MSPHTEEAAMRRIQRHRIIAGAALGALPLLLSTGCSYNVVVGGPAVVPADELARDASETLVESGRAPEDFTCSRDLPADVGAEIRCEFTEGGESVGVTITTTSVDGSDVQWELQIDEQPL